MNSKNILYTSKLLKPFVIPPLQLKFNTNTHSLYDSKCCTDNLPELQNQINVAQLSLQEKNNQLKAVDYDIIDLCNQKELLITIIAEQSQIIQEMLKDLKDIA